MTVLIKHLSSGGENPVGIDARVDGTQVTYRVRRQHPRRPWLCAEHGERRCEHVIALVGVIDDMTLEHMTAFKYPPAGGVRIIEVAAPPFDCQTAAVHATVDGRPVAAVGRDWSCLACDIDAGAPCEHAELVMAHLHGGVRQFVRPAR